MASQASDMLLQRNQNEIAAMQAQQAAQDPVIQMQIKEQQLEEQELLRKKQKDVLEASAKADQIKVEKERIASQERIAGMQFQKPTTPTYQSAAAPTQNNRRSWTDDVGSLIGQGWENVQDFGPLALFGGGSLWGR